LLFGKGSIKNPQSLKYYSFKIKIKLLKRRKKLVKDYKLIKTSKNDPLADARLADSIFEDQRAAFYSTIFLKCFNLL